MTDRLTLSRPDDWHYPFCVTRCSSHTCRCCALLLPVRISLSPPGRPCAYRQHAARYRPSGFWRRRTRGPPSIPDGYDLNLIRLANACQSRRHAHMQAISAKNLPCRRDDNSTRALNASGTYFPALEAHATWRSALVHGEVTHANVDI